MDEILPQPVAKLNQTPKQGLTDLPQAVAKTRHTVAMKRLVSALKPKATIPIHTLSGDSFGDYFPNVVRLEDKETFHINYAAANIEAEDKSSCSIDSSEFLRGYTL